LTAEENRALYGKCNSYHGHGHNYLLDVALAGELDEASSMLLPAATMDGIVKERVLARLDHCYLNREVDPFRELNPTVENIARTIWDWLDGAFAPARLQRIRLYETAKTWVDIDRQRLAAKLPTAQ
jgi:6-pyruvoyltetrahydropterin/6-carboxytetrahydropterin synthase